MHGQEVQTPEGDIVSMNKKLIVVGGVYRNNFGLVREVIAEGPEFVHDASQKDKDCIRFRVLRNTGRPSRGVPGEEANASRACFANWASKAVSEPAPAVAE
jgi:hypothetical protein